MKDLSAFARGTLNEILLQSSLTPFLERNGIDYKILTSYTTYSYKLQKKADIDMLLITSFGLYAIETKGFKSHLKGSYNDNMWIGNTYNKRYHIVNPVFQNKEHIRSLNTILHRNGYSKLNISNIVCVRNSCKRFTDATEVMSENEFFNRLIFDKSTKPSIYDVKEVYRLLLKFEL